MAVRSFAAESASSRAAARQTQYVAFLSRAPYSVDAWALGFATGQREDCTQQDEKYSSVDVPVWMLDNDFKNPDLDRFTEVCRALQPRVGVVGDVETASAVETVVAAARELRATLDDFTPIVVPKSAAALSACPDDVVLGYPVGYSDVQAPDFSDPVDWAGRSVHILGGSPPTQWDAIQLLTGSGTVAGEQAALDAFGTDTSLGWEPANIVGLDWNGLHRVAMLGEFWHHESPHWRRADELTVRATVRKGLRHVRRFWMDRGVWPETVPHDRPSWPGADLADEPSFDMPCCGNCGCELGFRPDTEPAAIVEYENGMTLAYCSDTCRDRLEYHEPLVPVRFADAATDSLYDMARAAWSNDSGMPC